MTTGWPLAPSFEWRVAQSSVPVPPIPRLQLNERLKVPVRGCQPEQPPGPLPLRPSSSSSFRATGPDRAVSPM